MKKCHFIGIGGIGMSGLARILLKKKVDVSGSDIASSYVTEGLVKDGAKVYIGHSANYVTPDTTVVYSTDIKNSNPEFEAAKRLQCKMMHRSDLLLAVMEGHKTLAVAGTHGKTTTSSLLASTMVSGGTKAGFAVGGIVNQFKANAQYGEGEYFVAEADESDGTFLKYDSYGAIITNIDLDHMNHFGTEENLIREFHKFALNVKAEEHLFWCYDDERLRKLSLPGVSYGLTEGADLRAYNVEQNGWTLCFDVDYKGKTYSNVEVSLIGKHNVLNALAVFGLCLSLGVKEIEIRKAFLAFEGVKRRCEKKADLNGILILDDYAHHPTEVKTTLNGIRKAIKERRLIAVFQPHRYGRTKDCLGTYGGIFDSADELIVTEIYGAGEAPLPNVTHKEVLAEIQSQTRMPCRHVPRKELCEMLSSELRPHDVVVTLGAGDITKFGNELSEHLQNAPVKKYRIGVVFGGCSVEHEISCKSAKFVQDALNDQFYDVTYFGITKQGKWIVGQDALQRLVEQKNSDDESTHGISVEALQHLQKCDVIFPVLHGTLGEDGTIQGFFEMLDKAYVGCDHRTSAIAMDKALTKQVVSAKGVATAPSIDFSEHEWKKDSKALLNTIRDQWEFPVFVKPVHLGSSVGISKVNSFDELEKAINFAFCFDTHVLVEKGVKAREIEFAALGNDDVMISLPGEICTDGKFYDYDLKYGPNALKTKAVADLSKELQAEGMALAKRVYRATNCTGLARLDFFLDENNRFLFNEINPIPGLTKISLYPLMCAASGYDNYALIDRLISAALQRKRKQNRLQVSHEG